MTARTVTLLLITALFAHPGFAEESEPPSEDVEVEAEEGVPAPDPFVEKAENLLAEYKALRSEGRELQKRSERESGEDRLVLEEQAWERALAGHKKVIELATAVRSREVGEGQPDPLRKELVVLLEDAYPRYHSYLEWRRKRTESFRKRHQAAQGEERIALGEELTGEQAKHQRTLNATRELIAEMAAVQIDVESAQADLTRRLQFRAENLSGRLSLTLKDRRRLKQRLERTPDSAPLLEESDQLDVRRNAITRLLSQTADTMDALDLETAQYRELVIRSTGEISADLLNREVALGLFDSWREDVSKWLRQRGPNWLFRAFLFFAVLAMFRLFAFVVKRLVRRGVASSKLQMSQLLRATLVAWSSRVTMMLGILVAISQLGIEIGPLLAGLGIAGFIVGFALQDSLANFAAGAMILVYRPFDVGDVIEAAAVMGKVSEMSLVSTTILTFDNQTLIIPNNKIWSGVIRNVTHQTIRRVDLSFMVSYQSDVSEVESVLQSVIAAEERILDEPPAQIHLHQLEESGMHFVVRPWVETADYWSTYWDLTREIKRSFDEAGIAIARPQRDLHVVRASDPPEL